MILNNLPVGFPRFFSHLFALGNTIGVDGLEALLRGVQHLTHLQQLWLHSLFPATYLLKSIFRVEERVHVCLICMLVWSSYRQCLHFGFVPHVIIRRHVRIGVAVYVELGIRKKITR